VVVRVENWQKAAYPDRADMIPEQQSTGRNASNRLTTRPFSSLTNSWRRSRCPGHVSLSLVSDKCSGIGNYDRSACQASICEEPGAGNPHAGIREGALGQPGVPTSILHGVDGDRQSVAP